MTSMWSLTHKHTPSLTENMTELFFCREDLYTFLVQHLHDVDITWLWSTSTIIDYAWAQRGYVPYDHLLWERSPPSLPTPNGQPVSYWAIMVLHVHDGEHVPRGGMPRRDDDDPMRYIADPKKAMMHWAQHKLQSDTPSILGPTSTMLLKAAVRTISALMHSKRPAQTHQIMVAAYRRVGLPDPFQQPADN